MSTIFYKDNPYGGTTTVTDAGHVLVTQGSDTVTAQAKFNTQTTAIQRILGNFATVEESTTASKAYNVGDYLVLNSFLYKVTYPIAAGGTIDNTQNGNVTKTTAGKEFGNGGGGGGSSVMELTQAQYDALSEEEKMDDIIYLIKDSPDNYLDEVFGDFASVEYTNTASKAYAIGDYLVYDNKFYKVTAAIAQGGTITVGTNVVQTNVGDEIKNRGTVLIEYKTINLPTDNYYVATTYTAQKPGYRLISVGFATQYAAMRVWKCRIVNNDVIQYAVSTYDTKNTLLGTLEFTLTYIRADYF